MKIDLHMHSTVSDGTDAPEEILRKVKDAGIGLFSLTDHDAVKGCRVIRDLLSEGDPRFIPGAEFSCRDGRGKVHILGYGFDPESEAVNRLAAAGHSYRMNKVRARLDFLRREFGFVFSEEDVDALLSLDNPGKPHIALLMVKYGYVKTKAEGIREYLDRLRIAGWYIGPEEAIREILASGGTPVLAHPVFGSGDQMIRGRELEERVRRLTGAGLRGLEGFYSGYTDGIRREVAALADRFGLYLTAGSDYHGFHKTVSLGDTGPGSDIFRDPDAMPAGLRRFLSDVCGMEDF